LTLACIDHKSSAAVATLTLNSNILITVDMADPTQPKEAGRFWLLGMNLAAGEQPNWPSAIGRFGLHHAIVHADTAYCSRRDACLVVVDVSDHSAPRLVTHKSWSPPFGGGTHNCMPLPEREVQGYQDRVESSVDVVKRPRL